MCQSCINGGQPQAAIWWRVSTDSQKSISPDTQVNETLALAESEGFYVPPEHIIVTDWHSLSVWESPAMRRLKGLIAEQAIHAVFLYHPDRAPDKPAHRLLFRALCEEFNVGVRCCYACPSLASWNQATPRQSRLPFDQEKGHAPPKRLPC